MTYITPDWVALEQEAKTYWPRPQQSPRFIGGWGFRGEVIPLLSEAPLPPLALKVTHTVPVPRPVPRPGLVTTSPFEQDYQDARGPGLIPGTTKNLQGLGWLGTVEEMTFVDKWSPWELIETYRGWGIYRQVLTAAPPRSRSYTGPTLGSTVFAVASPGAGTSSLVNDQATPMAGGQASPRTLVDARARVDQYIADQAAAPAHASAVAAQIATQWSTLPQTIVPPMPNEGATAFAPPAAIDPWYNSRGTWMAAGGAGLLGLALLAWLKSRR